MRPGDIVRIKEEGLGVMTPMPGCPHENNKSFRGMTVIDLGLVIAVCNTKYSDRPWMRKEALVLVKNRLGWAVTDELWVLE